MTTTTPLTHTTTDRWTADVLEAETPVLVELGAAWCPPCRAIQPVLQRLDEEHPGLRVLTLDTDAETEIASRYGVLSLPTLLGFRDGVEVLRLVGARPYGRLASEIEPLIGA